jgi:hypothetical protein
MNNRVTKMKSSVNTAFFVLILLFLSSCRQGTEPFQNEDTELKEIETFSRKVMRPNFNDLLYTGQAFTTLWDLGVEGGFVNIHLYRGDNYFYTIVKKTKNDRRYKWVVPDDLPVAGDYKIKVEIFSEPSNYGFSTKFTVNKY